MDLHVGVNLYPLRQERLSPAIATFWKALEGRDGLTVKRGQFHTLVEGSDEAVFDAVREAFRAARDVGPCAMTMTVKEARERSMPEP